MKNVDLPKVRNLVFLMANVLIGLISLWYFGEKENKMLLEKTLSVIGSNRNDLYSHKFPSIFKSFFSLYSFGIIYVSALLNWCLQNRWLGNRRISNFTRFKSFCMISLFSYSVFLILMKVFAAIDFIGKVPLSFCLISFFASSLLVEHFLIIKKYSIVEKNKWWGYLASFFTTIIMLGLYYIQPIVLYCFVKE